MRVTQGEQSQSHKGAQIWEDALSRSKEYGVGQQLLADAILLAPAQRVFPDLCAFV